MIEATSNYYTFRVVWEAISSRLWRRPEKIEPEVLTSAEAFLPRTEVELAVHAALVLAGEPVNNRRLAELMGCLLGEASRRVAQLEGAIRKARKGREVLISLN